MKKKLLITCICLLYNTISFADTNMYDIFYGIQKSIDTVSDIQQLLKNIDEKSNPPKQSVGNIPLQQTTNQATSSNIGKSTTNEEFPVLLPFFNDRLGLYGYQTVTGKMIITPRFYDAKAFSEGLGAVYDGNRWGYINEWGEYEIKPIFGGYAGDDEVIVHPFVNGTAAVYLGDGNANGFADIKVEQYALIDKQGAKIKTFDCIYPNWYGYSKGNVGEYRVIIGGQNYIVDSQGNILR